MDDVLQQRGYNPVNTAPIEITLDGSNPYQFYNPGSTVSGNVIYRSDASAHRLELAFEGYNKCSIIEGDPRAGAITGHALLFSYRQKLHEGSSRDSGEKHWFRNRFPTNSEGRRTSQTTKGSGDWQPSTHTLPPSFDMTAVSYTSSVCLEDYWSGSASKPDATSGCSVEYVLTAILTIAGQDPISVTLPILFMPFSIKARPTDPQQTLIDPWSMTSGWPPPQRAGLHSEGSSPPVHLLTFDGKSTRSSLPIEWAVALSFRSELIVGKAVRLQMWQHWHHGRDQRTDHLLGRTETIQIQCLSVYSTTRWRISSDSSRSRTEVELIKEHQETISLEPRPVKSSGYGAKLEELGYQPDQNKAEDFEVIIPSRISPSFRSFLITHQHTFSGEIVLITDQGRFVGHFEIPVTIQSPMKASLLTKKMFQQSLTYSGMRRRGSCWS